MITEAWQRRASKKYYETEQGKQIARAASAKYANTRLQVLREIKAEQGCMRCGEKNPIVLQFHHRNPSEKELTSYRLITSSLEKVEAEIAKCDVLCANCHLIIHEELRSGQGWLE